MSFCFAPALMCVTQTPLSRIDLSVAESIETGCSGLVCSNRLVVQGRQSTKSAESRKVERLPRVIDSDENFGDLA